MTVVNSASFGLVPLQVVCHFLLKEIEKKSFSQLILRIEVAR